MLAAIIAVLPAIMTPGSSIPVVPLLIILTVILGNGYIWIYFSTQWALRGNLLESLRNE
jgi:hypothetical protein